MSTPTVKAIPDGMHALTPHLICEGADEAIAAYVAGLRGDSGEADSWLHFEKFGLLLLEFEVAEVG